jgi:hypothetical protein
MATRVALNHCEVNGRFTLSCRAIAVASVIEGKFCPTGQRAPRVSKQGKGSKPDTEQLRVGLAYLPRLALKPARSQPRKAPNAIAVTFLAFVVGSAAG